MINESHPPQINVSGTVPKSIRHITPSHQEASSEINAIFIAFTAIIPRWNGMSDPTGPVWMPLRRGYWIMEPANITSYRRNIRESNPSSSVRLPVTLWNKAVNDENVPNRDKEPNGMREMVGFLAAKTRVVRNRGTFRGAGDPGSIQAMFASKMFDVRSWAKLSNSGGSFVESLNRLGVK